VLRKFGFYDCEVVNILGRLDKALKKLLRLFLATHPEHQIEGVEIMGTPHVITWEGATKPQIESMKSGKLAKLPRQILDRFDEFNNTTTLTFQGIYNLCELVSQIVVPGVKVFSIRVIAQNGSLSDHPISQEEIAAI
jgi:hypothetical protein